MMRNKLRTAIANAASQQRKQAVVRSQRRPASNWTKNVGSTTSEASRRRLLLLASASATSLAILGGGGLAFSNISRTNCDDNVAKPQQRSGNHSVVDLVMPSLQALLRVLRLLQTTGLIVLDYELYKWQHKATKFVNQYTSAKSATDNEKDTATTTTSKTMEDLSHMTTSQLQHYWEQEVKRRHDIFEKAQMEYASPSSKQDLPPNMNSMDEWKISQKQAMKDAANAWVEAEDELKKVGGSQISQIHQHAAERLVTLCRTNAGVYIKIGQHLANLDYLIPQEYIDTLGCLLDDAPSSTYEKVCQVVEEDLGGMPSQLFDRFDPVPIASASLAQVHVAYDKETGQKLAIKVQHRGLRETCKGDLLALTTVVAALEFFLEDFNFGWIADEIAPALPQELDFTNEGKNAERAAKFLSTRQSGDHPDVVIPKVLWNQTSERVLSMEFEEGFRATDVDAIRQANMNPKDVAQLISRVFHSQTFLDGWVHCDPHPANVLLRKSQKTGKPQMVLVDHGLYKQLDNDFRITYAELWKALMMADIPTIRQTCRELGVDGKLYTLLSGLLTARPFDEVVERSKTGSFDLSAKSKVQHKSQQDKAVIRGYAQKFLVDILTMIDKLPRQMVLLLKMNDCLRHIDYALGSPSNNLVMAGRVASKAVYEHRLESPTVGPWNRFKAWAEYVTVMWKIQIYDVGIWWMERSRKTIEF